MTENSEHNAVRLRKLFLLVGYKMKHSFSPMLHCFHFPKYLRKELEWKNLDHNQTMELLETPLL